MSSGFDRAIQNLVQIIKESDKNKTFALDTQAEVLRVEDGTAWVHLPGGVDETPVKLTMNAQVGDVVQVRIAGGRAWLTGNATSPPTDDKVANQAMGVAASAQQEAIIVKEVVAENIKATNAKFEYVEADTAKIHNLEADEIHAGITYTNELIADNITAQDIAADHATIDDLDANYAHIADGVIDNAKIGYADVNDLEAHYARITNGIIDNATINHADVNGLNVNYAQVNLANIDQAIINSEWVDTIMVQSGLISHVGSIFELDAIQVNANNITAGTLDVERLIVTVDGEKYLVHIDTTTGDPSYEKLDGDVIEDLTITADKIVAGAITADKITTENIIGSGGWINLRNGTFSYADAGENNYLKWNGRKLQIKADEFILSTGQNVIDAIEAIETYFLAGEPTLTNEPAVDWTTDNLKNQHLRDVYYDTDSGKSYRWSLSTEEALRDENDEVLQDEEDLDLIGGFAETRYAWIQIADGDIASLSDRVSTAETQIAQNQAQIQLKASQADLDLATTRLSTAETTINQQAQAIALKAEASSVYSKLEIDGKFHEGLNIRTTFSDSAVTLTATLILAGVDITNNYFAEDFEWFYRLPNGDVSVYGAGTSTYGKSITIQKSNMTYGQSIICVFTKRAEEALTDDNGDILLDQNDESLIGYVEVA